MKKKGLANVDLPVIIISLLVVSGVVAYLAMFPEQGTAIADNLVKSITGNLGSGFLWFGFFALIACLGLGFSKYGEIRLGEGKPEYKTSSWIAMMICAGIGSATVYWAFNEWAFYYMTPALGIEPYSTSAAEWAGAYNLFHWGFTAWALYIITSLPVAYAYHVRKSGGLKLSEICQGVFGEKIAKGPVGKLVDIIFIFGAIGGLGITLGLSIPLVATGVSEITGLPDNFMLQVGIVLVISILFSLSSYVGLDKGMKKISDMNTYLVLIFLAVVLFSGPTQFIIKNTTNSIGIMLQNYIQMSLWTDPINQGGFPEAWTIFYWAYWLTYTPFMGLFVAKISKGRKIKEVIFTMLLAGSLGVFVFFGIISNYTMDLELTGALGVTELINTVGGNVAAIEVLKTMPMSNVMIALFAIITLLFLATTLDSASFTLASTTTKELPKDGNPSPVLKLFWCIILALVPLSMMFIKAPLGTVQTMAIVVTVPLVVVLLLMILKLFKWLGEDYGKMSRITIEEEAERKAV